MAQEQSNRIPGEGHWLRLTNSRESTITLIVEPWAVECEINPGEECYVFVAEYADHLPEFDVAGDVISLFASLAIVYLGRELLYNFCPYEVGSPPFVEPLLSK